MNPDVNDTNVFRYCGEYFDKETGTIYLRARYYDPTIGRMITEDPAQDGLNWYTYCGNNPSRFSDPSGLRWEELSDLIAATFGSSEGLVWDEKTNTASYGSINFGSAAFIYEMSGELIMESSVFADKIGLSGKYGSDDMYMSEEDTLLALCLESVSTKIQGGLYQSYTMDQFVSDVAGYVMTGALVWAVIEEALAYGGASSLGRVPVSILSKISSLTNKGGGISSKSISDLPQNVQKAYKGYSGNGWSGNYKGQIQQGVNEANAGGIYKNTDGKLPTGVTYKEFDVNISPIGTGRDAERFVRGSDGSLYYTSDHYTTFTKIP